MNKWILVLALAILIGGGACPAFAGEPVINHLADLASGHNDYIETWGYVAKTISLEEVPFISILNADSRVEMATPIGDDSFRKGILKVGLEF